MSFQQHIAERWIYNPQHRHRLLGLSLLALHLAALPGAGEALRITSLFVHFALFLVWQPFWRGAEFGARGALIILVSVTGLLVWPGWLILTMWLLLLIGLLGGEHIPSRQSGRIQWLAVGALFLILLLSVVPQLFQAQIAAPLLAEVARYAAGALALLLALLPGGGQADEHVDYLRSLSITLMALLLSMGGALWMYAAQIDYTLALFQTLLFVAGFILIVNWVWSNRSGHSILQILWNRYLLNLGTPFEDFLRNLSVHAGSARKPEEFLTQALNELLTLNWVIGLSCADRAADIELAVGAADGAELAVCEGDFEIVFYTDRKVGISFELHLQLLVRLIEHFYRALQRERQLETAMRMEAIHQTGSRLTHDIKNLLQSMEYLAAVVQAAGPEQAEDSLALLQRQFPELRNRLQLTLEKLKSPEQEHDVRKISAADWWAQLKQRYADGRIRFEEDIDGDAEVPKELFDSVAENLIENASFKRVVERNIEISARLEIGAGRASLEVHDSGEAVPAQVVRGLFREAVSSKQGLGVGLYQSHRLAQLHGYDLGLVANRDGDVGFLLEPTA